jgi:peptide subunit release factor RF-3
LHQLVEEDPSLIITHDQHLKQMVLSGQGEMHLEIARFRLKDRYGVEVDFYGRGSHTGRRFRATRVRRIATRSRRAVQASLPTFR